MIVGGLIMCMFDENGRCEGCGRCDSYDEDMYDEDEFDSNN